MILQDLSYKLQENHRSFIDYIHSLKDDEFMFSYNGKWTAGQQLDHICRAVKPLTLAFGLPNFTLKLLFGKANRASRTYEGLVKKYKTKLESGGRATGRFIPQPITISQRETKAMALSKSIDKICTQIKEYSEQDLDELILPHPLLGKLTIREMLYFTIFHVEHHHLLAMHYLENAE